MTSHIALEIEKPKPIVATTLGRDGKRYCGCRPQPRLRDSELAGLASWAVLTHLACGGILYT